MRNDFCVKFTHAGNEGLASTDPSFTLQQSGITCFQVQ